eukprot:TRINITY_DN8208_c0_g1_i1.p1 TRINITY_DN8208_c0_g1~~TRINITY_DN8208_c0_g1_i1.p1  ORF type:complete len:356 (-),score=94.72 TRINITY_DN8208_c0_g1_i1:57-1067(-)
MEVPDASVVVEGETKKIVIEPQVIVGDRLDKFLASSKLGMSRAVILNMIKDGKITVNGKEVKGSYKIRGKDEILIPPVEKKEPEEIRPENIPLEIVYEDDQLIVVNKPAGMMVHCSPGNYSGTLVNALLHHTKTLSRGEDKDRPGIVHRLDRDTSGLMVIAKDDATHQHLKEQFQSRKTKKKYAAIVNGIPKSDPLNPITVIDRPIARHPKDINKMVISEDGKDAVTDFTITKSFAIQKQKYSLLDIQIHTGRTHQIRIHLSSLGHPLVGDPIYGKKKSEGDGLYLVAKNLQFTHPIKLEELKFSIPLPDTFTRFISRGKEVKEAPSKTDPYAEFM